MLDRESILKAVDLPREEVAVPEWGGSVLVRTLTGAERDAFEQAMLDSRGGTQRVRIANLKARLVVASVCDADGQALFGPQDIPALNAKSAKALNRIFVVAQRLSGLSDEAVDELVGNSDGDQNDASGSN